MQFQYSLPSFHAWIAWDALTIQQAVRMALMSRRAAGRIGFKPPCNGPSLFLTLHTCSYSTIQQAVRMALMSRRAVGRIGFKPPCRGQSLFSTLHCCSYSMHCLHFMHALHEMLWRFSRPWEWPWCLAGQLHELDLSPIVRGSLSFRLCVHAVSACIARIACMRCMRSLDDSAGHKNYLLSRRAVGHRWMFQLELWGLPPYFLAIRIALMISRVAEELP